VELRTNESCDFFFSVIRCRDLLRLNGNSINAYVKVAILPADNNDNVYQRTAVHRNSSRPYFDHRFVVDLKDGDANKRVQLAVWHRDRQCK
jgi:C2 domain